MRLISRVLRSLAQNALHLAEIEFDRSEIELAGDHVDDVADQRSAAGRENQFGDAIGRRHGRFEIRAALEAMRSVGVNAVALRHAPHRDRIPPCRLDQDVLRLLGDHRVEAAHHSGEADRLFGVGHDQIFGRELALDAIERLQRFAGACLANDQPPAFEQIEIENVGRLAAFPENVVGGVDRVADGTLIEKRKTIGNLCGRGLDRARHEFRAP